MGTGGSGGARDAARAIGWPGRAAWVRRNTGDFYITFPAVAGRWYRVEESNDLITWTPLYDLGVWPTSEPINLSSNSTGSRYFLRVRVGPEPPESTRCCA